MRMNLWTLGLAALLAAGTSAAQQFDFSFEINQTGLPNDGVLFQGHADGDLSGNLISNLSNIWITVTGELNGSPLTNAPGSDFADYTCCDATQAGAGLGTLSVDGSQNNFLFVSNWMGQPLSILWDPQSSSDPQYASFTAYVSGYYGTPSNATQWMGGLFPGWNKFDYSAWTLTAVPSVPEPETWSLLFAGLILPAAARWRKRQRALPA
ncbi:PEP-CTERM sorting domain-containing protein [Silvimonas amylolytica]|nr:PEP-CTERM sorting domain-containing protein [Silvimonas amylolytica]